MIGMIRRILGVSGKYRGRIYGAMGFSFLKGLLMKVPIVLTYFVVTTFIDGTLTKKTALCGAIALVAGIIAQAVFQYFADRLQSGAGYLIFADMRMKLGEHLRRLPMGYFTEGNIGKISSVLSTDMVFIEENCMMVLADMIPSVKLRGRSASQGSRSLPMHFVNMQAVHRCNTVRRRQNMFDK